MSSLSCGARAEKWVHDAVPVDVFDTVECAGTILCCGKTKTVNIYFCIYRVLAAAYITFVNLWVVYRFADAGILEYVLIYLTHWGLWIDCIYMWSSAILHFVVFEAVTRKYGKHDSHNDDDRHDDNGAPSPARQNSVENISLKDYKTIDELNLRRLWRIVLLFLNTSLSVAIFIILLYWGLVYDYSRSSPLAISWNTHGVAGGLVTLDWLLSTWQLTYWGVIFPLGFGALFSVFSLLYYLGGGTNENGDRYIYSALDWSSPGRASVYVIVILVAIAIFHLSLVAIKNCLIKSWLKTRTSQEKSILIVTDNANGNASVSLTAQFEADNNKNVKVNPNETIVNMPNMSNENNGKNGNNENRPHAVGGTVNGQRVNTSIVYNDDNNNVTTAVELGNTKNANSAKSVGL